MQYQCFEIYIEKGDMNKLPDDCGEAFRSGLRDLAEKGYRILLGDMESKGIPYKLLLGFEETNWDLYAGVKPDFLALADSLNLPYGSICLFKDLVMP